MKREVKWLFAVFFVILFLRLLLAFSVSGFSDDNSYQVARYVEHITKTGKPIFFDQLSYNGRDVLYFPLYHYILALFNLFLPLGFVLKLLPNLFLSSLVFIVYFIAKEFYEYDYLALLSAGVSGFVPVLFSSLNNASVYSLVLPLVFYLIYCSLKIKERLRGFLVASLLLALLHPSAFLFLFALVIYLLISVSESFKLSNIKKEAFLFSGFSILLIEFLIYKKAFLEYGFRAIWGNVPIQILSKYFSFNFLELIYQIGIFSVIFGFLGILLAIFKKRREVYFLSSLILSTFLLLWLRLIPLEFGMMALGVGLSIAAVFGLNGAYVYLKRTRLKHPVVYFWIIVLFLAIVFSIIPSYQGAVGEIREVHSEEEVRVLEWVKENGLPDVTVLGRVDEGGFISFVSGRRNVIDDNFLLAGNSEEILSDVESIYETKSETNALNLLEKYNVNYIYLSEGELEYIKDESCFRRIFDGEPTLYEVFC